MLVSIKTVDATTNVPIANVSVEYRVFQDPEIEGDGETDDDGLLLIGQFKNGQVMCIDENFLKQKP
jgi:hypothetical protein